MAKHEQVVFDRDDASIACEELWRCHEVLLIGLASYGEIERLAGVQSNYYSELHAPDPDKIAEYEKPLIVRVFALLNDESNWRAVEQLAEALLRDKTIDGPRARKMILEARRPSSQAAVAEVVPITALHGGGPR